MRVRVKNACEMVRRVPGPRMLSAKSLQVCLTLCDPTDCRPPGSSVQEILQARILEWVAISFSRGSSQPRNQTQVSSIAVRLYQLSYKESPHVSILLFKISHLSASMYQCPCSEVILGLSAFILNS